MDLRELVAGLLRRWYLVLVALLLVAGVVVALDQRVSPTYQSSASVVLVPPKAVNDPNVNRFLSLSDTTTAVDVVARAMGSDANVSALAAQVPGASYVVTGDPTTSAPVLVITTSGTDATPVQQLLRAVLTRLPQVLDQLQATTGTPADQRITSVTLASSAAATANVKSKVRVLAVAAVGLLGASLLAILVLDGLLVRRSRRRAAKRGAVSPREWADADDVHAEHARGGRPRESALAGRRRGSSAASGPRSGRP